MSRYFISFSPGQIVPFDSTINEEYIIRCLHRAVKYQDGAYLTSALKSLSVAIQHNLHKEINTDTLLDYLIPILQNKCRQKQLLKALRTVRVDLDGDANGATGFSRCLFHSAVCAADYRSI